MQDSICLFTAGLEFLLRNMKWTKLFFPPVWVTGLLTIVSAVALIQVFTNGLTDLPIAFAVYVLSFCSLLVLSLLLGMLFFKGYESSKKKIYANVYARRYVTDAVFKTEINLVCSLVLDLFYAGVNALLAVLYDTHWFAVFAGYYAVLSLMRFMLFRNIGKSLRIMNRLDELKRVRVCAYILLTVNLALSALVLMMLYNPWDFGHMGMLIYVAALYSFAALILSLAGLIRFRRYQSPALSASKMISLTAALVSMLTLEGMMFSVFGGDMTLEVQKIFIALTGAGICAAIVCMALYLIIRTTKELNAVLEI